MIDHHNITDLLQKMEEPLNIIADNSLGYAAGILIRIADESINKDLKKTFLEPPRSILKRNSVDESGGKEIDVVDTIPRDESKTDIFCDCRGDPIEELPFPFTISLGEDKEEEEEEGEGEDKIIEEKGMKRVAFADTLQRSLVEIRNFTPSTENLNLWAENDYFQNHFKLSRSNSEELEKDLIKNVNSALERPASIALCFKDPSSHPAFTEVFERQNVVLEKCGTRDRTITGIILVKNIDFKKYVFVRHTTDKWRTMSDTSATYLPNSSDGHTDRFMFILEYPKTRYSEMEFCIGYCVRSEEYWDNNHRKNYKVQDVMLQTIEEKAG